MPHCIVEYSDNLAKTGDIAGLLKAIAQKFRTEPEVFPVSGLRVRAIRLTEVELTDGTSDDAFVNVTAKIGDGRPLEFRQKFFGELFEIVKAHFAPLWGSRGLALSLYVEINDPDGSWKINNIASRLKAQA